MEVNRHPLTVDVVVQEILRHVSPSMKDLLVFRQVCRIWRVLATPLISSRSLELPLITFTAERATGNDENANGCRSCNAEYSLLLKYIDYLETDADQKIIFSVFNFKAISLDHSIVQRFLEEFGHTVKKFYLNGREWNNAERSHLSKCDRAAKVKTETFRQLLISYPNLEELVIGHVNPEGGEDGFLHPDDNFQTNIKRMAWVEENQFYVHDQCSPNEKFISDMLKVCPSLERFLYVEDEEGRFTKVLSQSPHLSVLKELTLPEAAEFQLLIQDGLKLRKLKFDELHVQEPEGFRRFLDTQSSSLETLIVDDWRVDPNNAAIEFHQLPRVQFPDVMEKLTVFRIAHPLSIRDGNPDPDPIFVQLLFEPLDFRRQFPVLKTLILGGDIMRYDLNDLFAPGWEPQMVLEGLELPDCIQYEDLRQMSDLFPNVKYLKLQGVEEAELRVLWTLWSGLESLFLILGALGGVNIESAMTGLSSQQIPLAQSLIENREAINIQADNPSILNFQYLKELRIFEDEEYKDDIPGSFLSDVSIHYVLTKLPKLEFFGAALHKFTDEGINLLCVNGLKWNKNGDWPLQCQKELEYIQKPNCNEDFADYEIKKCTNKFTN